MKEGWEYKTLGEVCEIYQPKTISSKDLIPNGKYKVYGANGIIGRFDRYNHEESEVLLCCRGATCGAINESEPFSWINGNAMVIRPKSQIIAKTFLKYQLIGLDFSKVITGAAQPQITRKTLSPTIIGIPPLSEQQRIVSNLDSAFAKIDAVAKNAEDSLNEAKALFQSALTKMMKPKEGWEEVTMDKLCSIESTLVNPTKADYINMLHVGGANIESYSGKLVNLKTAKEEKLSSGKFLFDNKVVLYNKIRPYLVKVAKPEFCGLCSADMYPLSPKKKVTRELLYYILISKDFTDYAIKSSARAGMPKINRNSLFAYKTSIPKDCKEQNSITSKLDGIRRGLIALESNLTHTLSECAALKQSILRETFE